MKSGNNEIKKGTYVTWNDNARFGWADWAHTSTEVVKVIKIEINTGVFEGHKTAYFDKPLDKIDHAFTCWLKVVPAPKRTNKLKDFGHRLMVWLLK